MGTHCSFIFRGYIITHILMAYNLHGFHGHLGSKGSTAYIDLQCHVAIQ